MAAVSGDQAIAQLVSELFEAWNAHDPGRAAALYAPDYEGLDVGESGAQQGPRAIEATLSRYVGAFPDLHFTAHEVVIEGDRAAVVWTARGTHRGELMRIPPCGRTVAVRGMSLLTVEQNRITRALYMWDVAGLLRAIGLLPEL